MLSGNVAYARGDLKAALSLPDTDLGKKVFAICYSHDPVYIIRNLNALLNKEDFSATWRSRVRILLSAELLSFGLKADAFQALRAVDQSSLSGLKDQWVPFFSSTFNYLIKILTDQGVDKVNEPFNASVSAVFGDSHVLGLSAVASPRLSRFYIPGIKIGTLASPLHSHHREAMMNAHSGTYNIEKLFYSIGEIDSRDFIFKTAKDVSYFEDREGMFVNATEDAFRFISSLSSALQTQTIILPPRYAMGMVNCHAAQSELSDDAFFERLAYIWGKYTGIIESTAKDFGFNCIRYDLDACGDLGFADQENFVDHAHLALPIYKRLSDQICG